jgi:ABC-2 type transport system permease protein
MSGILAARPGSVRWLVQHELRLTWRTAGQRRTLGNAIAVTFWLVLHVLAGSAFSQWSAAVAAMPAWQVPVLGAATWALILAMLAAAIPGALSAMFERGDLDLLLASPLPARKVFMARGLGIAANVTQVFLYLLSPVANVGLLFGFPRLLALYPVLPALALGVTALGILASLAMVRVLGARRASTVGRVLVTVTSAVVILLFQLRQLVDADVAGRLIADVVRWSAPGGPLAPDSVAWLPARALGGAPLPLLAVVLGGVGAFWLAVTLMHERFLAGTQASVKGSAVRSATAPGKVPRFRSGLWWPVAAKEWRLICRDPQLVTQTLVQLAYAIVPAVTVVVKHDGGASSLALLLVPGIVFLAASLTGSLAWITVAAEDVPDLLRMAPVAPVRLRWMKAAVALVPAWLLAVPTLAIAARSDPWTLSIGLACLAGSTISAVMVQVWYPIQAKRQDMARRRVTGGIPSAIGLVVTLAWIAAGVCLHAAPA